MGKRELDILWSLSDQIPDEFLNFYAKSMRGHYHKNTDTRRMLQLNMRRKHPNRHEIFGLVAQDASDSGFRMFPDFLHKMEVLGIPTQYIEHASYQTQEEGRGVTPQEIVDAFTEARQARPWSEAQSKDPASLIVYNMIDERRGGSFCAFMNDLSDEKVLGTGTFGAVFRLGDLVYKVFYQRTYGGTDTRGEDPLQELILLAFVTVLADRERNPHFTRLVEANMCAQVMDLEKGVRPFKYLFMTMEPISGTLAGVWFDLKPHEGKSLFFQHLKACQFLIRHGIVHFDMHNNNIGYDNTDIEFIDYEDGWVVPTYGRIGKVMDFGRSDRYIDPVRRTRFNKGLWPMPYDKFNPANDPLSVVHTYYTTMQKTERIDEDNEFTQAVKTAVDFCEKEFNDTFFNIVDKVPSFSLVALARTDDVTFVDRLMEAVFPEYRK